MRGVFFVALTAAVPAGCSTLPEPVVNDRFAVNYAELAACAYQQAAQGDQTLQYKELRAANTAIIAKVLSAVPIWEAKVIGEGAAASRVEIQAFPTVWGPDLHAREIRTIITACADRLASASIPSSIPGSLRAPSKTR